MAKIPYTIMDTAKGECYICKTMGYTHLHHVFDGANRKLSTEYGLVVYLCPYCHNIGKQSVHESIERMRKLQAETQKRFEETTGSRTEFMAIFGRNYIMEE